MVGKLAAFVRSDIPRDIASKIHALLKDFTQVAHERLQKLGLNLLLFPMFINHNQFIGIDSSAVHVVYTTEGVTSAIISGMERDFRGRGSLTKEQIIKSCVSELGYKDIHYFCFSIALLDQSSEERKACLQQLVDGYIQGRIQPLVILNNLGLTEAMRYLHNARARFDTKTPEGYSDCKANCRNALVSAIKALTGKENIREGVKELAKQDILGEREEELVDAFANLLTALYGVASKKGAHPPLATEEDDAELVLNLTQSILNYVANRAIRLKQQTRQ